MFLDNYPCTSSEFACSRILRGLSSAPAILLIHGFMGSPYDLQWIGTQLNDAGYTVYIPRLPGHGTNAKDFQANSYKDWIRCVFHVYIDISAKHEQVFVAGHSMGGLLASLLAARFNPEKLLLFAPAFSFTDKRIALSPIAKLFCKRITVNESSFYQEPAFLTAMKDYIGVRYLAQVADFYTLQKLTKKNIAYIKAETFIVLSHKDRSVPFSVKNFLDERLKTVKKYLILEESSHQVTDDVERETVAKKTIEFLKL